MRATSLALIVLGSLLSAQVGLAQDKYVYVPKKIEASERKNRGWVPKLTLNLNLSFAHASKVVGAQDGTTLSIGPGIDAGVDYYRAPHEWRTSFNYRLVESKTPAIDQFVKTVDALKLETIYLYSLESPSWLGPFAQAAVETSVLPGHDVRAAPVSYLIKEIDDTVRSETGTELSLTRAWSPTTFRQAVGVFAKPYDTKEAVIEGRLGAGAREAVVRNGFAITDDAATPTIEVTRLRSYQQIGVEAYAGASGTFLFEQLGQDRPLNYALNVNVMVPLYSSFTANQSAFELTNLAIEGKVGVKIFSWMSLDYALTIARAPLIVDALQIQNSLVFNLAYTFQPEEPPAPAK